MPSKSVVFGGCAVRAAGFFQCGGSNETAHANSLSLCCLRDFMLFLFSVVRGDGLPYDRCQFTSNEGTRLLFHTRDGSTFGRKVISLMVVWNTLEQSNRDIPSRVCDGEDSGFRRIHSRLCWCSWSTLFRQNGHHLSSQRDGEDTPQLMRKFVFTVARVGAVPDSQSDVQIAEPS